MKWCMATRMVFMMILYNLVKLVTNNQCLRSFTHQHTLFMQFYDTVVKERGTSHPGNTAATSNFR